ncbi:MAG: hypothetical protein ACTHJN_18010 [Ginsengibacter sp.]
MHFSIFHNNITPIISAIKKGTFALLIICLIAAKAEAQGNLLIFPKRVVFDGSKRLEILNLSNTGNDSATYMISILQIRMKEDGSFEKINEPDSGQYFADKNIRFFPRTVTLAPHEAQTVKVQVIKTNELATGEYRSHLYFRAVPKEKPRGEEDAQSAQKGISVKLIPIFGISIPVIIDKGENTAAVNLSDLSFKMVDNTLPTLKMTFNRSGNRSVYGDVSVYHISWEGKTTLVGSAKGLAVYTPTKLRHFTIQLNNGYGINFHSGKLLVVYSDQSAKPVKLAEKEIVLD